jgi:hypothetical protein
MKSSRLRRWQLINNGRDEARRRTLSVRRMSKNHTGWIEDSDPIALQNRPGGRRPDAARLNRRLGYIVQAPVKVWHH